MDWNKLPVIQVNGILSKKFIHFSIGLEPERDGLLKTDKEKEFLKGNGGWDWDLGIGIRG